MCGHSICVWVVRWGGYGGDEVVWGGGEAGAGVGGTMKDAASDGDCANECTYALHVKDPSSDTHHHPVHHTHAHCRHLSVPHPVAPPPTHSSIMRLGCPVGLNISIFRNNLRANKHRRQDALDKGTG